MVKFFFSLWILLAEATANGRDEQLNWLAFGDIFGNFESCGCDPKTDLGGIARIANFILSKRQQYSDLLVFDLGNLGQDSTNKTKQQFLEEGISLIMPDAILLNRYELMALSSLPSYKQRFVLSNHNKNVVNKKISTGGAVIFGYTWDDNLKNSLTKWSNQLKEEFEKQIMSENDKVPVLLFSGPSKHLQDIMAADIFHIILISGRELPEPVPNIDMLQPLLFRKYLDEHGEVWQVPWQGKGILLGGKLRKEASLELDEIFTGGTKKPTNKNFLSETKENFISWMKPQYQPTKEQKIYKLVTDYNKQTTLDFQKMLAVVNKNPGYVGALACKGCHLKEYEIWSNTRHSKAFSTLVQKNKERDSECVGCHVVGFNKGGYNEKSSHLANVQCENCHGPRLSHIKNPKQNEAVVKAKEICVNCHKVPHSSAFNFKEYWPKIKHP